MTIGWGIIGIGRHADRRMAPAINQASNSRLVSVYSRQRERATLFATKHGAERSYDDLDALLGDEAVDAVYIASPNSLHAPQTIRAAGAGKHVLCEKPMALTRAEAEAMVEACQRQGVKLGVGFHLRHHPAHQELRRLVGAGELGEVVMVRAQFAVGTPAAVRTPRVAPTGPLRSWWGDPQMVGGGVMMGMGVHALDLLRYLVGQEVVEVSAFTDGQREEQPLESIVAAILKFEDGAYAFMDTSGSIPEADNSVVIYGTKATGSAMGTVGVEPVGELRLSSSEATAEWQFRARDLYTAEIEAFGQGIEYETDYGATGWDGLKVVEITNAIFESSRTGQAIRLPG